MKNRFYIYLKIAKRFLNRAEETNDEKTIRFYLELASIYNEKFEISLN